MLPVTSFVFTAGIVAVFLYEYQYRLLKSTKPAKIENPPLTRQYSVQMEEEGGREQEHEHEHDHEHEEDHQVESIEGPGREYELNYQNEELLEKLKLLDYEEGYLSNKQLRPIQKHTFIRSTNVGEQFFQFTTLAGWLIRKGGNESFQMPEEFDDPNATTARILNELRNKEVSVDFTANKLRQGAGEKALFVLDKLADLALDYLKFQFDQFVPPIEEEEQVALEQEEPDEDDISIQAESDNQDWNNVYDDDDDAAIVDLAAPVSNNLQAQLIPKSDVDAAAWQQEVDRVSHLLKITIRQDAKDWRLHLEQMHTMSEQMRELIALARPQLEQITTDMDKSLERISAREKALNQQMGLILGTFREAQDKRAEAREQYRSASGGVNDRTESLKMISDDIDQLKQQIEEQGAKTTDGAPLVRVKQAVVKMEADIQALTVQIGVLENSVLTAQVRDRARAHTAEMFDVTL